MDCVHTSTSKLTVGLDQGHLNCLKTPLGDLWLKNCHQNWGVEYKLQNPRKRRERNKCKGSLLELSVFYNVLGGLQDVSTSAGQHSVADLAKIGKRSKYCVLFEMMKSFILLKKKIKIKYILLGALD